ncbi:hypothetical protein GCM10009851_14540 [Herbiconiux moechotypicola]|uniref:Uncharacterized protein n=1 Tax=Herbiconiux moechotypicola TaxID=637393 RepID=A0ABP5QB55_9MICO
MLTNGAESDSPSSPGAAEAGRPPASIVPAITAIAPIIAPIRPRIRRRFVATLLSDPIAIPPSTANQPA